MKKNFRSKIGVWAAIMLFIVGLIPQYAVFARTNGSSALLEKEDIDVVFKYIDLTDPTLKRDGIPQIKKDEDNGELKYAVRSVLKNLPWARKIFIVMPNDKVRYFKDPELINDKIVYIKDKDVLGFDSASSKVFEFNFHRLKNFGVSKNFVYMNDDYFIGRPLKKSDFFYEENGKIVPYVIYSDSVGRGQRKKIREHYEYLKRKVRGAHPHTNFGFQFQKIAGIMFLYDVFKRDIIAPSGNLYYFPHNAMGENTDELEEVYNLVKKNYKYANDCLTEKIRTNNAFVHQTVYSFYVLNKYKRKIRRLSLAYIDMASVMRESFNYQLFCINTGGDRPYTDEEYAQARVKMNALFPKVTPYETPEIENGVYTISSALNKNKVVDVSGASTGDGANIHLWSKNNSNAQKFKISYQSDGSYVLEPLCSGKRVDVSAAGKEPGTNIWQYQKNGTDAQKWYIIPAGKGFYNLISACNNLCMDVKAAETKSGTNIQCWSANGTPAQKFKFIKCDC